MNENIENNDWMNEAPALAAMGKRNPFSVPDGYFENLTEQIQTRIALSEMPKAENIFTVPENYFDKLQSRITDRIAASEPKREAKVIPLWRRNIVKYASAACFLLMASFGIYFYQNSTNTVQQVQSAETVNEQMLYDIDESTIIDHLETQNATSSNIKTTSASDTEMENYILSNFSSSDLSQELNN